MNTNSSDRPPTRIALVGGGAAAVCLLDRLSRTPGLGRGTITVFEPSGSLWRGRAYQLDTDAVLANIIPSEMSARVGDPGHFLRWLREFGLPFGEGDYAADGYFPPRWVFGSYLERTGETAVRALSLDGLPVRIVKEAVVAARETDREVVLTSSDGRSQAFDYVVCAVGAGRPADHYGLHGSPGYFGDPYPLAATVAAVPESADVTVLGTGLAAVDAVVSLAAHGHRGRITMASRNGALPAVRQRPVFPEITHFTPAALHAAAARSDDRWIKLGDVLDLLARELAEHGADPSVVLAELLSLGDEAPMERLRRQYEDIDAADTGLRVLQHAVPESGPDAWTLLRPEDQRFIRENHYRAVMSLCCPMPPPTLAGSSTCTGPAGCASRAACGTSNRWPREASTSPPTPGSTRATSSSTPSAPPRTGCPSGPAPSSTPSSRTASASTTRTAVCASNRPPAGPWAAGGHTAGCTPSATWAPEPSSSPPACPPSSNGPTT